jgi:hypothetical protein
VSSLIITVVKVKLSRYRPGEALGVQEVEAPEFVDNRHMKNNNSSSSSSSNCNRCCSLLLGIVYMVR